MKRGGSGHFRIVIGDGTRSRLIIAAWSPRSGRQLEELRTNIRKQLGDTR